MPEIAVDTLILLGMLAGWTLICWLADFFDL